MENNRITGFCRFCGGSLYSGEKFCTSCGRPVQQDTFPQSTNQQSQNQPVFDQREYRQAPYYQKPYQQTWEYVYAMYPDADPALVGRMSPSGFRKACRNVKYLASVRRWAIASYVFSGVSLLLALLSGSYLACVDTAIVIGLTLGFHLKKSRGCAIGLLIYGIITVALCLVLAGELRGWAWLAVGIGAIKSIKMADEEYLAIRAASR